MNRRTMMQMLGSAVGVALLERGQLRANDKPFWKTAIGLNGFMSSSQHYHKTYPIWEILDFARRMGFDGVELVGGWPMGDYPSAHESRTHRRFEAHVRWIRPAGLFHSTRSRGGIRP